MSQPETILTAGIRRALGSFARHARLFRNQRGVLWAGKVQSRDGDKVTLIHARQLECGLVDGAGDLIGWTTVTITPEMVGQKVAVFTSGEVKTPHARAPSTEQITWRDNVLAAGGRAGVIKRPEDVLELVRVA